MVFSTPVVIRTTGEMFSSSVFLVKWSEGIQLSLRINNISGFATISILNLLLLNILLIQIRSYILYEISLSLLRPYAQKIQSHI